MKKKDFSLRYEVEIMLDETFNVEMTKDQIDDVVEAIENYDTFLNLIGLFAVKGIEEIAERDNIKIDQEEVKYQLRVCREGINHIDL
jgi:hypothetical protein